MLATRRWRQDNPDKAADLAARLRANGNAAKTVARYRATHRLAISARRKAAYWADPEAARAEGRRIAAACDVTKRRARGRRRKARLRGATLTHSERDWNRLLNRYGGSCAYCGARATTRDHVIPLARGGSDGIGNILPACLSCNSSKQDRLLVEWLRA